MFPFPTHFDDYQARKVGANLSALKASWQALQASAPSWFEFRPGFQFRWDTSPAILIGPGSSGELSAGILFVYLYKGEWYFNSMPEDFSWDDCAPSPEEALRDLQKVLDVAPEALNRAGWVEQCPDIGAWSFRHPKYPGIVIEWSPGRQPK